MNLRKIGILMMGIGLILATSLCWAGDDYPTKPIQLVCPFAPGGDSNLSARIVADKLQEMLGQPVLVVNKPGGGSALGTNYVIASKPDGYTLLTASAPIVFIPIITPQLPYKIDDLVPIGRLATYNNFVVVNKNLPVNNMGELIAHVKKNPGTLSYGSPGIGTTGHFIGELINIETKLDLQHIPFNGVAPAITALLGNHVQVSYIGRASCLPHIKSGALKALMVLSNKRDPEIPQVPMTVEEGFGNLIAPAYHALYAQAKIPVPILKKLESALENALQDKEVGKKIEALWLTVAFLNSQDTKKFLDNEFKKWSIVAKKANIVVK